MREYMPIQHGQFNDILPSLNVVEYYDKAFKAQQSYLKTLAEEFEIERIAKSCGEKIRDAIYGVCIQKLSEHQKYKPADLMAHLINLYRERLNSYQSLGREDELFNIACKALLPFCKFDEEAFMKAAEDSGVLEGSKEAIKKLGSIRSVLSKKKSEWEMARKEYKPGVFRDNSIVFTGTAGTEEERAFERASAFVSEWRRRASVHSEPITIDCTSIRSYPDTGEASDIKRRWASCFKILEIKSSTSPDSYMARKYQ